MWLLRWPRFQNSQTFGNVKCGGGVEQIPPAPGKLGHFGGGKSGFFTCHLIGDIYPDYLGLGGPTRWCAELVVDVPRNGHAVMAEDQWLAIRHPFRLRHAVECDFGAGLWIPMKPW